MWYLTALLSNIFDQIREINLSAGKVWLLIICATVLIVFVPNLLEGRYRSIRCDRDGYIIIPADSPEDIKSDLDIKNFSLRMARLRFETEQAISTNKIWVDQKALERAEGCPS